MIQKTWHKLQSYNIKHPEVGDLSINFLRYHATTSLRAVKEPSTVLWIHGDLSKSELCCKAVILMYTKQPETGDFSI